LTPCLEKYFKKLTGNTDIEDSLRRLDLLTQEEARMSTAELLSVTQRELLKATHSVDDRVKGVAARMVTSELLKDISSEVQDVDVQLTRSLSL
jgi:hypothetical protein